MLYLLLLAIYFYIIVCYLPQTLIDKSTKPSTNPTANMTDTPPTINKMGEQQKSIEEECINESVALTNNNTSYTEKCNLNDNNGQFIQQLKEICKTRSTILPPSSEIALIQFLKDPSLLDDNSFINQLVNVTLQSLQLPPNDSLVEPLTNALRVSSSQPKFICNFISMLIGSPIDQIGGFLIIDKKGQNGHSKLVFDTISKTPPHKAIENADKKIDDRMAVSTLESINRTQAELWITYPPSKKSISALISPTSSTDTSKRSSFTCSDDASHSGDSDYTWFSSHHSSNTTVTTSSANKFNFSSFIIDDLHELRLNPFDASLQDVMKFQSDFRNIKSKIQSILLINQQQQSNNSPWSVQINQALELLAKNRDYLNDGLKEFECGYVFVQLCKMVTFCTKETQACFSKLANRVTMTQQDLDELKNRVMKCAHLVDCISRTFQESLITRKENQEVKLKSIYKIKLNVFTAVCDQALSQFKQIQSVWRCVYDIKTSITEGIDTLDQMDLSDAHISKTYAQSLDTMRNIRERIFSIVSQDLQVLVNEVISTASKTGAYNFTTFEKIINNLVNSVFYQLQQFKNNLLSSTLILEKYGNKQKLKLDIESSKLWLQAFKTNLVDFALTDCYQWNPITNSTICKEGFLDFEAQYNKFILNQYNTICEYFPRYSGSVISQCYTKKNIKFNANKTHGLNYQQVGDDMHLIEEYQWFQAFQGECDEVSDILKFISRIQQQQGSILEFIQHIEQFKEKLVSGVVLENEATRIYKDQFHAIQWPTALEYGPILGNKFYFYSQSLYLQVSKIKTDFITVCQDAFFFSKRA